MEKVTKPSDCSKDEMWSSWFGNVKDKINDISCVGNDDVSSLVKNIIMRCFFLKWWEANGSDKFEKFDESVLKGMLAEVKNEIEQDE